MKRIVLALDTAFKTTTTADFSAWQIWGESDRGYYLLFAGRGRVEYPALRGIVLSLCEQWHPSYVLIEDAASGQSLIQELRSSTSLPIKAVKVDRDKISRAEAITPLIESGRVFLPADAPWLQEYLDELSAFPNGTHDDAVDCTTMALAFLRGQKSVFGVFELLKKGWDGFSNTFKSKDPTPEYLTKGAILEVEKQVLGIKTESPKWGPPPTLPCASCKSALTFWTDQHHLHCRQCGSDFDDESKVLKTQKDGPCCENPILREVSGMIRCQQCGAQTWPNGAGPAAGVSRADYLSGNISNAREFRFPGQFR